MSNPIRELARSLREREREAVERARTTHYAHVSASEPLEVTLGHADVVLSEPDDLTLSQNVRQYHAQYGLSVGDTLIVAQMADGDWVALDVQGSGDIEAIEPGTGPPGPAGGPGPAGDPGPEGGGTAGPVVDFYDDFHSNRFDEYVQVPTDLDYWHRGTPGAVDGSLIDSTPDNDWGTEMLLSVATGPIFQDGEVTIECVDHIGDGNVGFWVGFLTPAGQGFGVTYYTDYYTDGTGAFEIGRYDPPIVSTGAWEWLTVPTVPMALDQVFWLRIIREDLKVTVQLWLTNPATFGAPVATASYTIGDPAVETDPTQRADDVAVFSQAQFAGLGMQTYSATPGVGEIRSVTVRSGVAGLAHPHTLATRGAIQEADSDLLPMQALTVYDGLRAIDDPARGRTLIDDTKLSIYQDNYDFYPGGESGIGTEAPLLRDEFENNARIYQSWQTGGGQPRPLDDVRNSATIWTAFGSAFRQLSAAWASRGDTSLYVEAGFSTGAYGVYFGGTTDQRGMLIRSGFDKSPHLSAKIRIQRVAGTSNGVRVKLTYYDKAAPGTALSSVTSPAVVGVGEHDLTYTFADVPTPVSGEVFVRIEIYDDVTGSQGNAAFYVDDFQLGFLANAGTALPAITTPHGPYRVWTERAHTSRGASPRVMPQWTRWGGLTTHAKGHFAVHADKAHPKVRDFEMFVFLTMRDFPASGQANKSFIRFIIGEASTEFAKRSDYDYPGQLLCLSIFQPTTSDTFMAIEVEGIDPYTANITHFYEFDDLRVPRVDVPVTATHDADYGFGLKIIRRGREVGVEVYLAGYPGGAQGMFSVNNGDSLHYFGATPYATATTLISWADTMDNPCNPGLIMVNERTDGVLDPWGIHHIALNPGVATLPPDQWMNGPTGGTGVMRDTTNWYAVTGNERVAYYQDRQRVYFTGYMKSKGVGARIGSLWTRSTDTDGPFGPQGLAPQNPAYGYIISEGPTEEGYMYPVKVSPNGEMTILGAHLPPNNELVHFDPLHYRKDNSILGERASRAYP